jgi:hypothetical protein
MDGHSPFKRCSRLCPRLLFRIRQHVIYTPEQFLRTCNRLLAFPYLSNQLLAVSAHCFDLLFGRIDQNVGHDVTNAQSSVTRTWGHQVLHRATDRMRTAATSLHHDNPAPLDLLDLDPHRRSAMRTVNHRFARNGEAQVRLVSRIQSLLKCDEPPAARAGTRRPARHPAAE